MKSMWKMFVAVIAIAATSVSAQAAPLGVTDLGGGGGYTFNGGGAPGTNWVITYSNINTTTNQVNFVNLNAAQQRFTTLSTMTFSQSFNAITGGRQYNLVSMNPSSPNKIIYDSNVGTTLTFGSFNFSNVVAKIFDSSPNSIVISGLESLVTNTSPDYDYSQFANPGANFTISLNTQANQGTVNYQSLIAGAVASQNTGTESFTQTSVPRSDSDDGSVPEPTSMAVFGLLGIATGVAARRKVKKAQVA